MEIRVYFNVEKCSYICVIYFFSFIFIIEDELIYYEKSDFFLILDSIDFLA